jgi:hypothetical protein
VTTCGASDDRLAELYAHQLRFWRIKATDATFTHE